MSPLGLYIHIPFCRSKCPYCDFFSMRAKGCDYEKYSETLCKKLRIAKDRFNRKADTIYLGGGTPSVLGTELLCKIIKTAKDCFSVDEKAEITIEVNPNSGRELDFDALKSLGVNRISLGMQSANLNELKILGRTHSGDDVKTIVSKIKNAGISNISLDLMLGIPEQTKESLKQSIDFCSELGATHISSYILKIEEGTIFYKRRESYSFPDDDKTAELYLFAVKYLAEKGFEQYEISNFCKKGYESRHNLKYWKLEDYLGIGSAAHSFIDGKRFYYPRSIEAFENDEIIEDGTGGDREEFIMLSLRLKSGLNKEKYKQVFKEELPKDLLAKCEKYIKVGLMEQNETSLFLTPNGFLVSNSIISDLI